MSNPITRRDILKFTGGGILGLMFSPLPWKVLDDSSIWTQNWSLTPKLSHGPISTAFSHCTLCSAGCAIKAQCVSGIPYYVSGLENHPLTHGTLCARGIASHHMAHHLLRIVHPHKFAEKSDSSSMKAISLNDALDEITNRIQTSHGTIAILDHQPNRVISEVYCNFLQEMKNGIYVTPPSREDETLIVLQEMMKTTVPFGFDFEKTKLIVSFGAPLLDDWGIPGRMKAVRNNHEAKIIQIDSSHSRTAMQADEWIAITPGTENILALTIAHVFIYEGKIPNHIQQSALDFAQHKKLIKEFTPEKTAAFTGIAPDVVRNIALQLYHADSAIILSSANPGGGPFDYETQKVIASLNLLTGNIGKPGGIISRGEDPGYKLHDHEVQWSAIPDHSIETLIVDDADSGYAIPWQLIERKLIPQNNCIITLSSQLTELSAHSDFLIPAPAHFETLRDIPTPAGNDRATFTLSSPLLERQEGTIEPIEVIKKISTRLNLSLEIPAYEELLKGKVGTLYSTKRGSIYSYVDQSSQNVDQFSSADELWTKFLEGAIWIDEPAKQISKQYFSFGISHVQMTKSDNAELILTAQGWKGATSTAQLSPLMSKVFQETELRDNNGCVKVNPQTAFQYGIMNNETAVIETSQGKQNVRVKTSNTIPQGIIEAQIAPFQNGIETPAHPAGNNILNLCEIKSDGTWRSTPANLLKV